MASPAPTQPAPAPQPAPTPFARRLQAEWALLNHLLALNPGRLADPAAADATFHLTLLHTPARLLHTPGLLTTHRLRFVYPRFFPALPLELYLQTPVLHPNIHPETGFVCLWDQHRTANTIEHALHKTVSILGWRLFNFDPRHTMQTPAAQLSPRQGDQLRTELQSAPLHGLQLPSPSSTPSPSPSSTPTSTPAPTLRRRLS